MAEPTISLTDAGASVETKVAIGRIVNQDDEDDPGKPATTAQVNMWLVRRLRAQVLKSELKELNAADERTRRAELVAKGW